jgi:hypothetical protein
MIPDEFSIPRRNSNPTHNKNFAAEKAGCRSNLAKPRIDFRFYL